MKRALQFGQSLLRTLASRLASWADRLQNILGETSDRRDPFPCTPVAKESAPGSAIAEDRPMENENADGGPPHHWVERVRHAAPQLLRPRRNVPPDEAGRVVPPRRPFPAKAQLPPVPVRPPIADPAESKENQKGREPAAVRAPIESGPSKAAAASSRLRIIPAARFSKQSATKQSEAGNPSAPTSPQRPVPDLNRTKPAPSRPVVTRPTGSVATTPSPARGLAGFSPASGSPRLARTVAGDETQAQVPAGSEASSAPPRVEPTPPHESMWPEPDAGAQAAAGPAKWTEFSARSGRVEPLWTRSPGAHRERDYEPSAPTFATEAASALSDRGWTSASGDSAKFVTSAPAWPELPSAPDAETMDEVRLLLAERERRRRLDAEQEGTLWIG